jgi:hypothetical protein
MEENKLSPNAKLLSEEYYTVDDLSKYFSVSQDLIVHFVKNGTIKTINKGNQHMLIPKKDFNQGTKEMLEYLLSSPIDKKTIRDRIDGKISLIRAFWIFGLGMGLGSWFVSGQLFDFFAGTIMGIFIWFVLLIFFGGVIMGIYRWVREKLSKYGLIDGHADVKSEEYAKMIKAFREEAKKQSL